MDNLEVRLKEYVLILETQKNIAIGNARSEYESSTAFEGLDVALEELYCKFPEFKPREPSLDEDKKVYSNELSSGQEFVFWNDDSVGVIIYSDNHKFSVSVYKSLEEALSAGRKKK